MKNKKLLSLLLAMTMIFSLCSAGFAENGISGSNSITVSYNAAQNYEIMIPSGSPTIGSGTELPVSAKNVRLSEGTKLQISISSANGFALKLSDGDVTSSVPYSVKLGGSTIGNNTEILTVSAGQTSGSVTLVASVNSTSSLKLAGTHTDTLRFTCEVVDAAQEEGKTSTETSTTDTTTDDDTSTTGDGTPILDAVENKLNAQVPTLGGEAGEAGGGGTQEMPREGGNQKPQDPEPEPDPPKPYATQTF